MAAPVNSIGGFDAHVLVNAGEVYVDTCLRRGMSVQAINNMFSIAPHSVTGGQVAGTQITGLVEKVAAFLMGTPGAKFTSEQIRLHLDIPANLWSQRWGQIKAKLPSYLSTLPALQGVTKYGLESSGTNRNTVYFLAPLSERGGRQATKATKKRRRAAARTRDVSSVP